MGKKRKKTKGKYVHINGPKGVIALFLAILMLPFGSIAGILITAARIDSAVAIFDEALCNASNSTLGTYDSFLRKRFGLLAMSQEISGANSVSNDAVAGLIGDTFDYYMEQNLGSLSNTYFNYSSEVSGVYPLADNNVMLSEILNYSRYSVPVKLVEEGIDLDELVKKLEKRLKPAKNLINVVTGGANIATDFADLAEDLELLQDAVDEEDIAYIAYQTKYAAFEQAVEDYINIVNDMDDDISEYEKILVEANVDLNNLNTEKQRLELELENPDADVDAEQVAKLEELIKTIELLQDVRDTYGTTSQTKLSAVETARKEYSQAISELSSKMSAVQPKLTTVKAEINSLVQDIGSEAVSVAQTQLEQAKKSQEEAVKQKEQDLTAAINAGMTYDTINTLRSELATLEEELNETNNASVVVSAEQTGFKSAVSEGKRTMDAIDVDVYTEGVRELASLKTLVDSYDTQNISASLDKSTYYVTFSGRITSTMMQELMDNMVDDIAGQSIWAIAKALVSFIKALFNIALVYDPDLAAIIDTSYYGAVNGGLPSSRPQSAITNSFTEDAALSQEYKDLYGAYSVSSGTSLLSFDFCGLVGTAVSDLSIIISDISQIGSLIGLFRIASIISEIYTACKDLVNTITLIINNFSSLLSSVGEKILLTGYLAYMTSNRTTYTSTNLSGNSFNSRKQATTNSGGIGIDLIDGFAQLLSMASDGGAGNTRNCFVGAETEYLINGSMNEIANQSAVFVYIYAIRLICNIPTVLTDPEVAEIAAASTIAAPVIYILYILVEPLSDCILLVNDGQIDFIKTTPNLVVSGLGDYISSIASLKLNTATITVANENLLKALGDNEEYAKKHTEVYETDWGSQTGGKKNFKALFEFDYTTYLILMLTFTSTDTLVSRFSDIVEMEAIENAQNNVVNATGTFNLNYSYTYVRAKAKFSTNQFLSLSGNDLLQTRERIVYKGY